MATSTEAYAPEGSIIQTFGAGGTISQFDIVTLHTAAGEVVAASTEATGFGIAAHDAVDGDTIAVCTFGPFKVRVGEAFASIAGAPPFFTNDTSSEAHLAVDQQPCVGYLTVNSRTGDAYADQDLATCFVNFQTYSAA